MVNWACLTNIAVLNQLTNRLCAEIDCEVFLLVCKYFTNGRTLW